MGVPAAAVAGLMANGLNDHLTVARPMADWKSASAHSLPFVIVSVAPSYNTLYPTGRNGRRYLSDVGKAWYEANLPVLRRLVKPDRYPVILTYTILEWVRKGRDGSGMEKVIADGCVKEKVFTDDSLEYISGEDWRYRPSVGGAGVRVEWRYDDDPPLPKPKTKAKKKGVKK